MTMKLVTRGDFLLAAVFLCSSCGLGESISYEHGPSEKFYKSPDFPANYLSRFTANNVLFTADVNSGGKAAGNYDGSYIGGYVLWLGLHARSPGQSVFIYKATLKGVDRQLVELINAEFDITDKAKNPNLVEATVRLFDVREDTLEEMLDNDETITLEVGYSIDGVAGVMCFNLVRRVKLWWPAYPT